MIWKAQAQRAQNFAGRMRIVSFNVNGLRSFAKKTGNMSFNDYVLNVLKADILCVQETKGSAESLAAFHSLRDYRTFSSFYPKTGRHGVSTFVRRDLFCSKVVEVANGRILKTFHGRVTLYNCYLPFLDAGSATAEDGHRAYAIYDMLGADLPSSSVIFCGDLNACYNMLDHYQYAREATRLARAKELHLDSFDVKLPPVHMPGRNRTIGGIASTSDGNLHSDIPMPGNSSSGSTDKLCDSMMDGIEEQSYIERHNPSPRELSYIFLDLAALQRYFFNVYQRAWLLKLSERYTDTFRIFSTKLKEYTCWNTLLNNRPANLGTRIDYIFCSEDLECTGAGIMQEVMGSDHCPIFAEFSLAIEGKAEENLVLKKNNILNFLEKK